jgi:membrane protein
MVVDNGPHWAASIAYYALLSAVPIVLCVAAVMSFFIEPQWAVDRITNVLGDFVPQTEGTIEEMVNHAIAVRGRVGMISFVALLWTGTRVFDALTRAMNVAFDIDDDYSPLQRLAVQIAMLLSVGAFFVIALAAGFLDEPLWNVMRGATTDPSLAVTIITWLFRILLLFAAYLLLYRFVPRRSCDRMAIVAGAATATVLALVATGIFRVCIEQFGTYNLLYGPLAVVAIIMVWVGIISAVTVFGAEVVSHVHEMVIEGQSAEEVGRRHADRSPQQRPLEANVPRPTDAADRVRSHLG